MPSGRVGFGESPVQTEVTIDVGAATRNFYHYTYAPLRWEAMHSSADACDSTDKFTPSVAYKGPSDSGFTVIATGSVVTTPDAVTPYETLASTAPNQGIIPAGSTIRTTVTFAGTAANVTGVKVTNLWTMAH